MQMTRAFSIFISSKNDKAYDRRKYMGKFNLQKEKIAVDQ
jgi:hypothetical protein